MSDKTTPLKAIKDFCRNDCCQGDIRSWRDCQATDCALHKFRLGKNPYMKRKLPKAQREKAIQNLKYMKDQNDNERE